MAMVRKVGQRTLSRELCGKSPHSQTLSVFYWSIETRVNAAGIPETIALTFLELFKKYFLGI
jgi:hypothetical protein